MTKHRRATASFVALLVAMSVAIAAFSGGAAALSSTSITATDTAAGTATDHTITTTVDASGSVKTIVVTYDSANVELLEKDDVAVTYSSTDQTVGSISTVNASAVKITLDSAVSVSSTNNLEVAFTGEHVVNPYSTGSEQVRLTTQDTNGDDLATTTATFTVTKAGADTTVVVSSRSDDLETDTETVLGFDLPAVAGFGGQDFARYESDDIPVNGSASNATVTFAYADSNAQDRLEDATDGVSDGEWAPKVLMTADSTPVFVFADEAPDFIDEDEDTYAIYNTSSENVELHLGDDYDEEDEIGGTTINANKGLLAQLSVYGASAVPGIGADGLMGYFGVGSGMLFGAGLLVFGRPRIAA